jgi:hypothetical protein
MVDHAQGWQGLELLLSARDNRPVTSANVDLVRSIVAPGERGGYSAVDWAHPEIECVHADGQPRDERRVLMLQLELAAQPSGLGERHRNSRSSFPVLVAECQ